MIQVPREYLFNVSEERKINRETVRGDEGDGGKNVNEIRLHEIGYILFFISSSPSTFAYTCMRGRYYLFIRTA